MTGGQAANGIASAMALVTSGIFVLTWTFMGKWWRTWIGRAMVLKAIAIALTGMITVWLTLVDFSSNWDALRWLQASLWAMVSVSFIYHTYRVWRVNQEEKAKS